MKVHITATPEITPNEIDEIIAVLSAVKGEITFISGVPFTARQMRLRFHDYNGSENVDPFSFADFFHLCDSYSSNNNLPEDEFVVVLSSIQNEKEYISAFKNNYIFVRTTDWEKITKKDAKYGIAYQIVENIFESLIGIDIDNVDNDPNVHHSSIGCMTDMCDYENDVILKLRTAYICDSCLDRAVENNVNNRIILQIQLIIDNIRVEMMNFDRIKKELAPDKVSINEKGGVTIGDKVLDFQDLHQTLFIFFLIHLDGVKSKSLKDYKKELIKIYEKVRSKKGFHQPINNLCGIGESGKSTFQKNKYELNQTLIKEVGDQMSEFYILDNDKDIYKIKLPLDYLNIDLRL